MRHNFLKKKNKEVLIPCVMMLSITFWKLNWLRICPNVIKDDIFLTAIKEMRNKIDSWHTHGELVKSKENRKAKSYI